MARLFTSDKLFLSYLAGFVDGEGCISISRRWRNKEKGWYCFDPIISIANSDLKVLEYIQKRVGFGCVRGRKFYTDKKPMYSYYAANNQARILVKVLIPYLRVKKEQGKVLLTMPKRGGTQKPMIDKEKKKKQQDVYNRLKELKR